MKKLLIVLVGLVVFSSGCNYAPVYFSDGSWFWGVKDHSANPAGAHAFIFGCLTYPRQNTPGPDCDVDQDTDHMNGLACAYHPDGYAGCKGLSGPTPPQWASTSSGDYSTHTVSPTLGSWSYTRVAGGSYKQTTGCLDDFGPGGAPGHNWPCVGLGE